jgi:alkylation response protein AidB-like acyl-CoA dehydrogenase
VTYYQDVLVPTDMLIGVENQGWQLIAEQLNHERIGLAALIYAANGCFDQVVDWARETTTPGGTKVIDLPWVQQALAQAYVLLLANETMGNRVAWEIVEGVTRPELASAVKVFGTESMIEAMRLLLNVLGAGGLVAQGSPAALVNGRIEREFRKCQINTFGGGTAEVLRDIVAQFGLGLPRAPR